MLELNFIPTRKISKVDLGEDKRARLDDYSLPITLISYSKRERERLLSSFVCVAGVPPLKTVSSAERRVWNEF